MGVIQSILKFLRRLVLLYAAVSAASVSAGAVDGNRFFISADGASVEFSVRQVARRDVLDRLFAGQVVKLEWRHQGVANEVIRGTFAGPLTDVARQLLAPTNFILARDEDGRITRVLIIGRAADGKPVPGLAALQAALRPVNQSAFSTPPSAALPVPTAASLLRPEVAKGMPTKPQTGNAGKGVPAPLATDIPPPRPEPSSLVPVLSSTGRPLPSVAPSGAPGPALPGPRSSGTRM